MVGRRRELAQLDDVLAETAEGGPGRVVMVRGEAGIGRSRLVDEVAAMAEDRGFRVGRGRCWPNGGAPPLWPWHDVLETLIGPGAVELLDEREAGPAVDPERFARFRAVADSLAAVSTAAPVLVVLDDVHAGDAGVVLLAQFLARSPRLRRTVVVLTAREPLPPGDAVSTAVGRLGADAMVIHLGGLSDQEVAELAIERRRPLAVTELASVSRATGGNPLLVEELLATEGVTAFDEDSVAVRRAILARFRGVSRSTQEVLAAAAVVGAQASVRELAAVAGVEVESVLAARREAVASGLADAGCPAIGFAHEVLREAVLTELGPAAVVALNARAAVELTVPATGDNADGLVRRARHALAGAPAGPDAVAAAVDACRRAAEAMMHGFSYEAAAELLRSAVELSVSAEPAELCLDLARATMATGALAEARPWFVRAAEPAERRGDARLLAEAALGLGGIWVLEHRRLDEQERYHAMLERALTALGDGHPDLAARLRVRLSAERVYLDAASIDEVERAVAEVRATGDARGLAEALSIEHHVKLGPAYAGERLDLAVEVVRTASAAGDGVLTLMGLMWRTVDLYLAGRVEAERSLAELRQRADTLGVGSVRLVVSNIDVMRLQRAGRLDHAEREAEACLREGERIGDADAAAWYGGQVLARHWYEGRAASLLTLAQDLARLPTMATTSLVFTAAWAAIAAEAGRPDEVRNAIERLRGGSGLGGTGLAGIPQSSALLVTLFGVVEAAAGIDDAATAAEAYDLLLPHADLPIMGSLGVVCFGSVERSLGVAARTMGRLDLAVGHLERAVEANRRLANRPMYAISQAELARAFVEAGARDRERAASLLAGAIELADEMGLEARAGAWRGWQQEWERQSSGAALAGSEERGRLQRVGDHWELLAAGERAVVPNTLGVQYLARLLAQPGRAMTVGELTGRPAGETRQSVLDDAAKEAYRRYIVDLRARIDEADFDGDLERAAALRVELEAVIDELRRTLRPGGRSREFAGADERARTSVQKAIRRAIDRLAGDAPTLADGLRRSIRTGGDCVFEPVEGVASQWIVEP
jgi:tetratricopeptide (TPR) repeat protein